jgi:3-oxoacyl-[acyl-carrier-protein] synthase-3
LPENTIDNNYLSEKFPDWSSAKIFQKTCINKKVVYANQTPVDLAYGAAMNLFAQGAGAR